MWQRFADQARRIIFFAQEEAASLTEVYVGPEHLLLGILRERESVPAQILKALEVDLDRLRRDLLERLPPGKADLGQDMQLTPLAKRVIDRAYDESRRSNSNCVEAEHLLLGLARTTDCIASRVLTAHGADPDRIRDAVAHIHGVPPGEDAQRTLEVQLSRLPFRDLYRVLSGAEALAATDGKAWTTPEHLLIAALRPGTAAVTVVIATGANVDEVRRRLEPCGWIVPRSPGMDAPLDPEARAVLARMFAQFASSPDRQIDSRHLLEALLDEEAIKAILSREGINLERLRELLEKSEG